MQEASAPTKRRPGRPPSVEARQKVLAVARTILSTEGLGRLTIERVAEQSGVGKPTIYRSWANAQELAMAAFMAAPSRSVELPKSRSVRTALIDHLTAVAETFDSARGRQIALTMAAADSNSELAKAFRNQVILQSRSTGHLLIERGIQTGELRQPPDIDVVLDMIYGPIFYRLLVKQEGLRPASIRALVDLLIRGLKRNTAQ